MSENKLNEKTYLSLGLVISIIGGAVWLTTMHFNERADAANIQEVKADLKTDLEFKRTIDVRLSRIEYKLGLKPLTEEPKE